MSDKKPDLVAILDNRLERAGLPKPVKEYQFCEDRKWAFDRAYPDKRILIDVQGGIYTGQKSGHSSMFGMLEDMEKQNVANLEGWTVLLFPAQFIKGEVLTQTAKGMGCDRGPCKRCEHLKGRRCLIGQPRRAVTFKRKVSVKACAVDMVAEALGITDYKRLEE